MRVVALRDQIPGADVQEESCEQRKRRAEFSGGERQEEVEAMPRERMCTSTATPTGRGTRRGTRRGSGACSSASDRAARGRARSRGLRLPPSRTWGPPSAS